MCPWCIQKGNWKDKQTPPSSGNPLKMTAVRKGISWLICGGSFSSVEKPKELLGKPGEMHSFRRILFHSGGERTPLELPALGVCGYLPCSASEGEAGWLGHACREPHTSAHPADTWRCGSFSSIADSKKRTGSFTPSVLK